MACVEIKIKIDDKLLKSIDNIAKRKNTTRNKIINDMIEAELKATEIDIKK